MKFPFGKNWQKFLSRIREENILQAQQSILEPLNRKDLSGLNFLDIGSGSGLFSLAARTLGAKVHSFDYDLQSVNCANSLKEHYFPNSSDWTIQQGSVLEKSFLESLGQFDIVYSWGVLHHTGNMFQAFENILPLTKKDGYLFISIYNDQGKESRIWTWIKQKYNQSGFFIKGLFIFYTFWKQWASTFLRDAFKYLNPFYTWSQYKKERGMSAWHDLIDWAGGYPFEVAKPETIFGFFKERGYRLCYLKTCGGGIGCNEFIFQRDG